MFRLGPIPKPGPIRGRRQQLSETRYRRALRDRQNGKAPSEQRKGARGLSRPRSPIHSRTRLAHRAADAPNLPDSQGFQGNGRWLDCASAA